LEENGFQVSGFFYNPNIHPFQEFKNREQAIINLKQTRSVPEVFYPEYQPSEFFQAVNLEENKPQRCPICWYLRLQKTAEEAKARDFTHFSTTLLASPYQDQEALHKIGKDIATDTGVNFYYEDFRPGFREAHIEAKDKGIYCQNYCGCIYSEMERCRKSAKP